MNKKTASLLCAMLFVLQYIIFKNSNPDYRSFVWFVLFGNFFTATFVVLILLTQVASGRYQEPKSYIPRLALALIPICLFHFVSAIFLSFFARWEGFSLMTSQNTMKSEIFWFDIVTVFWQYLPIYFCYLLTKISLFALPRSALFGGFSLIKDALLCVITSIAVPLSVLKFSQSTAIDSNTANFFWISLIVFVPWSIFFGRDVQGHRIDKVPVIQATKNYPVKILETGTQGWGLLFIIFGLVFITAAFTVIKVSPFDTWEQHFTSLLLPLPFLAFGSFTVIVGLNMQWTRKATTITPQKVSTHVRIFVPWIKDIYWEAPLSEYRRPAKKILFHRGDSTTSARRSHEIVLNLKTQKPKKFRFELDRNVTLYKSYHDDNFEHELDDYQNLFKNTIQD
ncbi:MAG: hypothetical protein JNL11_18150 [Bdellovibrionaceae bacterium]|nr:hypothetical protein [Pseudobdellovibrionaceae bacterium]